MLRTFRNLLVTSTLTVGGLALAQGMPAQRTEAQKQKQGAYTEASGYVVPNDAKAVMERLHSANQKELQAAQLAQRTSQNPDVQQFAKQMIQEHTRADQRLTSQAKQLGFKLSDTPSSLSASEKAEQASDTAKLAELKTLKGAAFDIAFLTAQVAMHDRYTGKVMAALQSSNMDAQVRTLLTDLSQALPQHREQAFKLLTQQEETLSNLKAGGSAQVGGDTQDTGTGGSGSMDAGTGGSGSMEQDTGGTGGAGSMDMDAGTGGAGSVPDTTGTMDVHDGGTGGSGAIGMDDAGVGGAGTQQGTGTGATTGLDAGY